MYREVQTRIPVNYHCPELSWKLNLFEDEDAIDQVGVVNRVKRGNYETILDFIEFEKTPIAIGLKHMDPIIEAIQHYQCLKVTYHSFEHDQAAEVTIHAYFIKEYRNRWYVIGLKDATDKIRIYAFDRIIKAEATDTFYKKNTHFADNDYLKNCIGIHQGRGVTEKVVLKFQPKDGKYVVTQPLHRSRLLVEHDGPEVIIELNVIINFELTGIILSYGVAVEVLEPAALREKIRSIVQVISGLYTV